MEEYNYWNDSRVQAGMRNSCWQVVSKGGMQYTIQICDELIEGHAEGLAENDDDFERAVRVIHEKFGLDSQGRIVVGCRMEVCPTCDGHGTVTNPNIDCGGLSADDFYDDPDFADDYFGGRYDIQCPECKGKNVVPMPDLPKALQNAIAEWDREDAANVAEMCAERAMGA